MKVLLFAGSLRKDSYNKKLIRVVEQYIAPEHQTEVMDLQVLNIPVYDGDIETEHGAPEGVKILTQKISEADALIISSPEYNGSISSPLKNVIDWVSRVQPQNPWVKKPILLLGASPGALSAMRGLAHTRTPFMTLGAYLYPNVMGLGFANKAFNENHQLQDVATSERLQKLVREYLDYAQKLI